MENSEILAELFKVFSDATRVRILLALSEGEKNVGALAEEIAMSPSAVSHQLNTLRSSRLIRVRREGKSAYYALNDDHVRDILDCGKEHIEESVL